MWRSKTTTQRVVRESTHLDVLARLLETDRG
jgi:hypothetical protein